MKKIFTCISLAAATFMATTPVMAQQQKQLTDKEKAAVDAEIRERNNQERDMLIASIEKNRIANEKLLEANKELAESNRLLINEFSIKINSIEHNVVEIKEQIRM